MEKFQLQIFLNIIGIGSASGILFHNNSLFIISDNSSYLYEYAINTEELHKIALVENPKENIAKKEKYDFESITKNGNKLDVEHIGFMDPAGSIPQWMVNTNVVDSPMKTIKNLKRILKNWMNLIN